MPRRRWLNGPTARRERDARRADAVPIVFAGPLQVKLPDGTSDDRPFVQRDRTDSRSGSRPPPSDTPASAWGFLACPQEGLSKAHLRLELPETSRVATSPTGVPCGTVALRCSRARSASAQSYTACRRIPGVVSIGGKRCASDRWRACAGRHPARVALQGPRCTRD